MSTTRSRAAALAKVSAENRATLLKCADQLLVEYISAGGVLCGSEFGKELMTVAFEGRSVDVLIRNLIKWLDRDDVKRGKGQE